MTLSVVGFETKLQDGTFDVITERISFCAFIFTCMYQQRYTKRLVLVETARSVAKFYRSVVVFISFLADQASVTISRKGNTLGAVAVLIS